MYECKSHFAGCSRARAQMSAGNAAHARRDELCMAN